MKQIAKMYVAMVACLMVVGVATAAPVSYSFTATNDSTAGIFTGSFTFDASAGTPTDLGGGEFEYGGTEDSPGQPSPAVLPALELNNPDYPTAVWNLDDDYFFINIVTDAAGNPLRLNWDGDNVAGPGDTGGFMAGAMDFVGGTGTVGQDSGPNVHQAGYHKDPYSGVVLTLVGGGANPGTVILVK